MERIEYNDKFLAQLKRHEGLRLEAYLCPAGKLTIGWGHNCDVWPVAGVDKVGDVISRVKAEEILAEDVVFIAGELDDRLNFGWRKMIEPRQSVLLNMAFNLGVPKLLTFRKALRAMESRCWNEAAHEMLDSRWAEQVKGRAAELATQMVLGAWQEG